MSLPLSAYELYRSFRQPRADPTTCLLWCCPDVCSLVAPRTSCRKQYTLTDLLSLCEGFLQGVLDEENVSHLYHYADALAMPTFEHCCLTFILRNWQNVVR